MVDYEDSSQLHLWLFKSTTDLQACRARANLEARKFLAQREQQPSSAEAEAAPKAAAAPLPVSSFACGHRRRIENGKEEPVDTEAGPWKTEKGHPFLTPQEEGALVSFYGSKLPSLIGPLAQVPRLRRESKVTATAALLYRRFFLSNSVMLYDPKSLMVAAAFLASKVEDATADVRYLEQGTALMNAPVAALDIVTGEIALIAGVHFDLLCFHPYKAVLAFTEDLRTFLKSDKGQSLVVVQDDATGDAAHRPIVGQDLKPMYDGARQILQDAVLSDVPLLYNPGTVGLASLMVAQDQALQKAGSNQEGEDAAAEMPPHIDLMGYVRQRFDDKAAGSIAEESHLLDETLPQLRHMLESVREKAVTNDSSETMATLKGVHKKLKKVRVWGKSESKKKKRSTEADGGPDTKRRKT